MGMGVELYNIRGTQARWRTSQGSKRGSGKISQGVNQQRDKRPYYLGLSVYYYQIFCLFVCAIFAVYYICYCCVSVCLPGTAK